MYVHIYIYIHMSKSWYFVGGLRTLDGFASVTWNEMACVAWEGLNLGGNL